MRKNVLVIVAHPDDEIIWTGGMILKNINNWNLAIMSLCRKDDKERTTKFRKVCKILNAKCFISDLEDEKLGYVSKKEVIKRIKRYSNKNYDYIFTHGKNGEYDHKRHILVNKTVKDMLKKKIIKCKKLFLFDYIKKGIYCYPNKKADKFIKLEKKLFNKKRKLIHDVYGFDKKSFEYNCCRNAESFMVEMI